MCEIIMGYNFLAQFRGELINKFLCLILFTMTKSTQGNKFALNKHTLKGLPFGAPGLCVRNKQLDKFTLFNTQFPECVYVFSMRGTVAPK